MPFQRMIDACFARVGVDATYMPVGGAALTVKVIPGRPDQLVGVIGQDVATATALFDVRVSEVADPKALHAALQTLAGPEVRRNDPVPASVPAGGLVILRDGNPGEPEVVLSPLTYHWRHAAEVEVIVQETEPTARDATMDSILQGIAAAIDADPNLGGAVDHARPEAPEIVEEAVQGASSLKAARLDVILEYASANPLT